MRTLNLGILAHVDAGKTTLTERLLHAAGVIDETGTVDLGTTRTDSPALEQKHGIITKAAVVSFDIDGVKIDLTAVEAFEGGSSVRGCDVRRARWGVRSRRQEPTRRSKGCGR